MVHDAYTYLVDDYYARIIYGRGLYHRLHLVSTDPKWHPALYVRDDMLKEYTKEKAKEMYDKFIERQQKERHLIASHNLGITIIRNEGAFIRCLKNDNMIGFLHISQQMKDDLEVRLTAEFITNVAKEVFEQDADFGLYYCGSLCPPEAKFADYYYNWNGLEIRTKTKFEAQSLEEKNKQLQESLQQMMKNNDDLENKVKKLEEMEETRKREIQQLEEEVKKLKEEQQKMTIDDETSGQQSTA